MKFETGDMTDQLIVKVIVHEFSRCTLAFNSFINYSPRSVEEFRNPSRESNLYRYNSYGLFIQHLYEYFIACIKRDFKDTKGIPHDVSDALINLEVEKILGNWRFKINKGIAPNWVNDISYYEDSCPKDFGKDFRQIRNSLSHADYRRINGGNRITLSEFFKKYHKYIMLLYQNGREWWSIQDFNEIDLGDITEFNQQIYKDLF
jgi:hypothetical protein